MVQLAKRDTDVEMFWLLVRYVGLHEVENLVDLFRNKWRILAAFVAEIVVENKKKPWKSGGFKIQSAVRRGIEEMMHITISTLVCQQFCQQKKKNPLKSMLSEDL